MADQQIIPAAMPLSAHPLPIGGNRLGAVQAFLQQPAVARAVPAIAGLFLFGLAASAWLALQSPTQAPLYAGLADADKAAVAEALQASGIEYALDPASGALSVDAEKLHEAKMMLASQGLPKAQPSGDAMLAALPMGASRALEGETLRAAREADLARTIEAIDSVRAARVHLAMAEESVFVRDNRPAAASVMLTMQQGRSLSEAQVQAIRHLVASSVPGMAADQVSVVDQSGALLSSVESGNSALLDLQTRIEQRYREALISLLVPVLGRENFSVEVNADIDPSESQATRESFPEDARVLAREEGRNSRSTSAVPVAAGVPGALANQPPPATGLTATPPGGAQPGVPNEQSSEEDFKRSFELGREISVTHQPQGKLARLSVAVALRQGAKPLAAADIAKIDALVKGAVGYNAERGDQVAISARAFADTALAEPPIWDRPWLMPLVRQVAAALAAITLLLVLGFPLRKAMKRRAAEAQTRRDLIEAQLLSATDASPQPDAASHGSDITLEMIESAPSYEARAQLVRAFVRQDAERAAHIVRHLMQERGRGE